jgi:hypothetical protein
VLETVNREAAANVRSRAFLRGMKERTTNSQVECLGLEIGEEFVFLKHHRDLERKGFVLGQAQQLLEQEQRHRRMIFRAVIATLFSLVAVGAVAILYLFKRRPANLEFPETRWRKRLGAEWCGGGHIVVSLPTRTP